MPDERRTQQVTLGCGNLLLIAVIVAFFGGRPALGDLEREVQGLRSEVAELRKAVEAQTPLGRIGQVDDIAPAVAFFASDDAKWVTGETLYIAGGYR